HVAAMSAAGLTPDDWRASEHIDEIFHSIVVLDDFVVRVRLGTFIDSLEGVKLAISRLQLYEGGIFEGANPHKAHDMAWAERGVSFPQLAALLPAFMTTMRASIQATLNINHEWARQAKAE
ncbi:hypothetical protein Q9L58_010892, partial [Maublancomyces gigas]